MENIENVKLFVSSLDDSIDQLNVSLEPVLKKSLDELVASTTSPKDKIRLYNNYSYVLISVIFSYLKALGVNTDKHPIMKELNRIKSYMKRFKDLENNINKKDTSKEDAEQARRYLQNTLGTKINGGGAAQTSSLSQPAISSSNFKGVHKKFEDEEESDENSSSKNNTPAPSTVKRMKKSKSPGKVTKPKILKKSKTK